MTRQLTKRAVIAPRGNVRADVVVLHEVPTNCTSCAMRGFCLSVGLDPDDLAKFDNLVNLRLGIKRKACLFRAGDRFTALYALHSGTFKTVVMTQDGQEQVTGYHLGGEILGFDGIADDRHTCEAIALEDSAVCVLPYAELDKLSAHLPSLRHNLMRHMSRDLCRDRSQMLLLGSRAAEERLALFLLDLAERYAARGYSGVEFVLRMTRAEIGSFLGLKHETVSRSFSGMQEAGLIEVQGRTVKLLDTSAMKQLVHHGG